RDRRQATDWTLERGLRARLLSAEPAVGHVRDGQPAFEPGVFAKAAQFEGQTFLEPGDHGAFGFFDKFSMGAWIKPRGTHGGTILSRMVDTDRGEGYQLVVHDGTIQVNLVKRWLDDAIRVATHARLVPDRWQHVFFSYDGSRLA